MAARAGSVWKPALVLFGLAIGVYTAIVGLQPPPASPESAPPGEFSAVRAMRYVEELAAKPHPCGTAAHDEVLEKVVGLWTALGFDPEVQTAVLIDEKRASAVNIANVLARLKGTGAGKAVMFVAHYDSVPSSPGAADDAAGVAALLETARALKAGPAPKHDIIFLITDAEETGLFGARAFAREHAWAADVGLAVNFEARGTRGPSVMFETSAGNAAIVRAFAAAAPHAQATSFAVTIYRRMPNGTDLSEFLEAGMQGLNFAFIGEPRDYHTPGDSTAHLDPRSLQHHGSSALALARRFGETGVPPRGDADAVYFNVPSAGLVVYSSRAALIAAALALLLLAAAGVVGFRRGFLAPRKVLGSVLFLLLVFVLSPVVCVGFAKLVLRAHGAWLPAGEPGSNPSYFAALLFLAAVLSFVLYGLFRRKAGWQSLAFAATSFGAALTAALGVTIPGASYITGWPSLLGAAVLLGLFLFRTDRLDSGGGTAAVALSSFVTGVIFAGLLPFLFVALGFAPMGTGGLGVFMALAFLGIIPAIEALARKGTAAWTLILLLAFAASTVIGAATTRYSARHPKPSKMGYLLDLDTERADWFIDPDARDAWTDLFIPSLKPGFKTGEAWLDRMPLSSGEAPAVTLAPPLVEKLEETEEGEGRVLRVRVRSPRRIAELTVATGKDDGTAVELNGIPVAANRPGRKGLWIRLSCPGPDGAELRFRLEGREPLPVTVTEWISGLPEVPGRIWPEPPPEIMPVGLWTLVRKTWVL